MLFLLKWWSIIIPRYLISSTSPITSDCEPTSFKDLIGGLFLRVGVKAMYLVLATLNESFNESNKFLSKPNQFQIVFHWFSDFVSKNEKNIVCVWKNCTTNFWFLQKKTGPRTVPGIPILAVAGLLSIPFTRTNF